MNELQGWLLLGMSYLGIGSIIVVVCLTHVPIKNGADRFSALLVWLFWIFTIPIMILFGEHE